MNKTEFLNQLERLLKSLKKKECSKYLSYYSEMIDDAIEDGCTEEEAVNRIGTPGEIAQQILNEQDNQPGKPATPMQKILITILLILGAPLWGSLLLAAICLAAGIALTAAVLILSAYIVIWCVPITTGALSISSLLLSVISMIGSPVIFFGNAPVGVTQFGIGIFAAGIFLLSGLLTWVLGAYFIKVTVHFSRWLKNLFKRRKKEAFA